MFIWPLFLKISQDTDSPSYPGKAIRYTGGKKCFKIKKLHDEEPAVTEDHHLWLQIKWNWFPLSRDSSGWWSIMCKQLANSLPASQGCMKKEVGWGKPRMENDISTTDLNYLSPSQKAWLRSHLWISYVACWIEHHWRKKKKERERERGCSLLPSKIPIQGHTITWPEKNVYLCVLHFLAASELLTLPG